ncbi:hypothetical protein ABEB36_013461 [Hypothenemus hampei]|uniref:tRNA/rRNA methyltransferase SpoU type domain-containing protein n=1 Tax=Hypothenemus hampei TaxID=57062 RepID=A0ABD1E8C7_HYPHA
MVLKLLSERLNMEMDWSALNCLDDLIQKSVESKNLKLLAKLLNTRLTCCENQSNKQKLKYDVATPILNMEDTDTKLVINILDTYSKLCNNLEKLSATIIDKLNNCNLSLDKRFQLFKVLWINHPHPKYIFQSVEYILVHDLFIQSLKIDSGSRSSEVYEMFLKYYEILPELERINCINLLYDSEPNGNLTLLAAILNQINLKEELFLNERSCFNRVSFWSSIEGAISEHDQNCFTKHAKYILKKYVDFEINRGTNRFFLSKCTNEHWDAFFILIDVGREKQLHLVCPSLHLLKKITPLPFIWRKCCYSIYLQHSNATIVYKVAIEILSQSFQGLELNDIFNLVFPAINRTTYNNYSLEMYEKLETFCLDLDPDDHKRLVKEFVKPNWNVATFCKAIKHVFPVKRKIYRISSGLCQKVFNCAKRLPHIFLRNECLKYLIQVFWNNLDMNNIYTIMDAVTFDDGSNFSEYFENFQFSDEIVQFIRDQLILASTHFTSRKIFLYFAVLIAKNIDLWSYFHGSLYKLSPIAQIYVWSSHDCTLSDHRDVENFVKNFFYQQLSSSNSESLMTMKPLIHAFVTVTSKLNKTNLFFDALKQCEKSRSEHVQRLVALKVLLQDSDIQMEVTVEPNLMITILKYDEVINIAIDRPEICSICINAFFELHRQRGFSQDNTRKAVELFKSALNFLDNELLLNIYEKTLDLLKISQDHKRTVLDFIEILYRQLFEIKKDRYYKNIVNTFIQIYYTEDVITTTDTFNDLVNIYQLYPESRHNCITTIRKLLSNTENICCYQNCVRDIVNIYLQGVIISLEDRTEFRLCQEFIDIETEGKEKGINAKNPNQLNATSRYLALDILASISRKHFDLVFHYLQEPYQQYFKKRYFPNSKIHYEKLRILQAILILLYETKELKNPQVVLSFVLDCFNEERDQNCVRQILSLIFIFLLSKQCLNAKLIEDIFFTSNFVRLMPVLYHLISSKEIGEKDVIIEIIIEKLIPFSMGAQFKTRIYAQVILQKALECLCISKMKNYDFLKKGISQFISENELETILQTDAIFLRYLNPCPDLSWATVLYDIPRLNQVQYSEWTNWNIESHTLLRSTKENSQFSKATDRYLRKTKRNCPEDDGSEFGFEMSHIQKKNVPRNSDDFDWKYNDFLLIASLIEKPQNLGGLSRTCEIFGIKDVVFHNANIVQDKEFRSLSMSSELRINPIEVKDTDLFDYLIQLKRKSYWIIGAEQTANSEHLNQFQFPKKTALVLGNEKTGIPPRIIPLLDTCVDIPQFGETRSLNVHVAGAIFIWKYSEKWKCTHEI